VLRPVWYSHIYIHRRLAYYPSNPIFDRSCISSRTEDQLGKTSRGTNSTLRRERVRPARWDFVSKSSGFSSNRVFIETRRRPDWSERFGTTGAERFHFGNERNVHDTTCAICPIDGSDIYICYVCLDDRENRIPSETNCCHQPVRTRPQNHEPDLFSRTIDQPKLIDRTDRVDRRLRVIVRNSYR